MNVFEIEIESSLVTKDVTAFYEEVKECMQLYAKKNHDYGNSFNKGCDDIGDAYAVGRLYDKMNRLITLNKTHSEVKDESIEDTIRDLACYSIMYLAYIKNKNKESNIDTIEFK